MTFRVFAMLAMVSVRAGCAALAGASGPVAVYYSFDQRPSSVLFSELQSEVDRILSPSGIPVEWQEIGTSGDREYRDIFVIRFHGACTMDALDRSTAPLALGERALAQTQVSDGRVLPFADVHCDLMRRFLGTGTESVMGRAVARVVAHELYHMFSASVAHCRRGIARAEYTRDDLITSHFRFEPAETELLRQAAGAPESYNRDSNFLFAR